MQSDGNSGRASSDDEVSAGRNAEEPGAALDLEALERRLRGDGWQMACCHPDVLTFPLENTTYRGCVLDAGNPEACEFSAAEAGEARVQDREACQFWAEVARTEPAPLTIAEGLALLERARGSAWQPIESAPRDGTKVDLWVYFPERDRARRVADCVWDADEQSWRLGENFLAKQLLHPPVIDHWMPLPPPPENSLSDRAGHGTASAKADSGIDPEKAALLERVRGLEEALAKIEAEAIEGANDLDDPYTPAWDCSADNLGLIERNVKRFSDCYDIARSALLPALPEGERQEDTTSSVSLPSGLTARTEAPGQAGGWSDERQHDVTNPLARCARCGERAIEHDFRDKTHWCAGTENTFVSAEMARGCCMSDMSQPHTPECWSSRRHLPPESGQ